MNVKNLQTTTTTAANVQKPAESVQKNVWHINSNLISGYFLYRAKKQGLSTEAAQQKVILNLKADDYFEGDALQLKLQQAIAILPEKQQLVFKMKYFEDLKYEEISEILGTSVGALKASYHHAVKKIEEYIVNN